MTEAIIPEAAPRTGAPRLRFVFQKHWARSLHYDFRLEIGTALASWAVPKGPSKDPKVKRLAIHVEDHPLDYLLFEETLPEGGYGAGEVIVWDFGEFDVVGPAGYDAAAALGDGIVRFALYGKKLRGEWTIIRTRMGKGPRENWLLQKIDDEFAEAGYNPETEPASALSGKVPRGRP
ncbi:MAG TPA: DNA polymerase ligase N-terminal domain-containing protein [Thermoplasmata archaeon]|nr:DNA polymerase ligase N-terminal domain-containing protein [Thermoplasmata archaeon]